jgi:threonine dehydrogenase-like Zn-dependent dehydrogenase
MKAMVYYDVGDVRVESVPDLQIQQPIDAIVPITLAFICGSDQAAANTTSSESQNEVRNQAMRICIGKRDRVGYTQPANLPVE